jgi:enoyl-CoA hydratase
VLRTSSDVHLRARQRKCCALDYIAKQNKRDASKAKVTCAVATGPRDGGGFGIAVNMQIEERSIDQAELESFVREAHEKIYPYSHATRRQCARHTRSQRQIGVSHERQQKRTVPTQEDLMNADVLTTRVADGIAIITLGSARRIYFDAEMGDALTEALEGFAGDAKVRVVVITGGAPGYFNRHFDVGVLIELAESLRASGREWPENATYNGGFFDKAMALCESMPKPVIAAISGTALAGAFEFALACDLRIAEDGDYLIGLPEAHLGLLPGAGGTQRLPRTIGTPAALMHILMGNPLTPREAERKGLVHETVSGKALDRAMEIAQRLSLHPPEAVACIKRLVRNSTETPLAEGLALERNLFLKLCVSEPALARMRSYVEANVTSPSRSIVVEGD